MIRCLLLDLDGVVRHFDADHLAAVERRHGLAPGTLPATAFAPELIRPLTTGRITLAEWSDRIGRAVGSPDAVEAWLADRGTIDQEIMNLVAEIRRRGLLVAILTDGTDTVRRELADQGIDTAFDAIFNSAEIGVTKPHPAAFRHVCDTLDVRPPEVFFTDDAPHKVAGAVEIGMVAELYVDVPTLRAHLEKVPLATQS